MNNEYHFTKKLNFLNFFVPLQLNNDNINPIP